MQVKLREKGCFVREKRKFGKNHLKIARIFYFQPRAVGSSILAAGVHYLRIEGACYIGIGYYLKTKTA